MPRTIKNYGAQPQEEWNAFRKVGDLPHIGRPSRKYGRHGTAAGKMPALAVNLDAVRTFSSL